MNVPRASMSVHNWCELCIVALLETDTLKLPSRIAAAESAPIQRARELFFMSDDNSWEDNSEEAKAIDKGLYALWALRHCLGLTISEPECARSHPIAIGSGSRETL
jgi:hypothetical protein